MLKFLKKEANKTWTENGAATLRSTQSDCLDLFATVGALRRESEQEIRTRFGRAFTEDRALAMKLLFFARDVRGGLGERRVFRIGLEWLAEHAPAVLKKNLEHIAEYGRYDDLLVLLDTPLEQEMLGVIRSQLEKDKAALREGREVSLLGKWLPSVNASNAETVRRGKKIARALQMEESAYRKLLARLRAEIRILENHLRERDYTFDYEKQPSKALFKYRAAFQRNDEARYTAFLEKASRGEAKLNASTLAPYELVEPYLDSCRETRLTEEQKKSLNATWAALPDFGGDHSALAVIDTSGSMYGYGSPMPASVALSLGLYFAERNRGPFKNHFIEFSRTAQLIEIKGDTFADRLEYLSGFSEVADTNLEAVFDLILATAVKNRLPQKALPQTLVLISDMEFNYCVRDAGETNFKNAKKKFAAAGYRLPEIVFWNVASRNRQQPVSKNEQGVALVSGCTPRLFEQVLSGELAAKTPYTLMLEVLGSPRYERITA